MKAVRRGIEATIQGEGAFGEAFGQGFAVGGVGVQAAPFKFFQNRHEAGGYWSRRRGWQGEVFRCRRHLGGPVGHRRAQQN